MKAKRRILERTLRNNRDGYSLQIIAHATRWADLMEKRGKLTKGVAIATAKESGVGGMSNIQYGYAIIFLSHCWAMGDALMQLHNKKEITFLQK